MILYYHTLQVVRDVISHRSGCGGALTSVFQNKYPVQKGMKPAYMKEMNAVRGVQRK